MSDAIVRIVEADGVRAEYHWRGSAEQLAAVNAYSQELQRRLASARGRWDLREEMRLQQQQDAIMALERDHWSLDRLIVYAQPTTPTPE